MPAAQTLLFPDPQPLVERLGREFFRALPEKAGVYLMRGADETVLYVGKAKNLRKRLGSYRVANPERLPRRHLRLLRAVVRIETEECADEVSALAREAELLQTLKPRFNRAGTWRPPPRFLVWRIEADRLELAVMEMPEAGWREHGPLGSGAVVLQAVLARLLWIAAHPGRGIAGLPVGWAQGQFDGNIEICRGPGTEEVMSALDALFGVRNDAVPEAGAPMEVRNKVRNDAVPEAGAPMERAVCGEREGVIAFGDWVRSKQVAGAAVFEQSAVMADLEWLAEFPSLSRLSSAGQVG
jgi:predicted GIY-YIG superfamily endonuclease